jgi:hypothetical protein
MDAENMHSYLPDRATCNLTFTRKANTKFSNKFKERIIVVSKYFPELHEEFVRVGWIRPGGWARGSCWCSNTLTLKPLKINLQPNEKNFTIAHEFTHLLQARKKDELHIPSGEKACDLWALTRLPLELVDDCPTYIGSHQMRNRWLIVKKRVRELAFDAIEIRKVKRQYIVWFENEVRKLDKQL